MATITKGYTFGATEQVTNTTLHNLIDNGTITGIVNADIDVAAAIALTKLATTPMIYTDSRFKLGTFTRDLTSATGTQAVTGVGFEPKVCFLIANETTSGRETSIGIDDGTGVLSMGIFDDHNRNADTWTVCDTGISFMLMQESSAYSRGRVTAFGADGFTTSWTRTGAPIGTATIIYLACR